VEKEAKSGQGKGATCMQGRLSLLIHLSLGEHLSIVSPADTLRRSYYKKEAGGRGV
jgi:hypothetical protein